jgi:hypothetical protein
MYKPLLCFLFCRCFVLCSTYGDTLVDLSGSPIYVPARASNVIPITAPSTEPFIVFPTTVPFQISRSPSTQPSAVRSGIPSATLKIPSTAPSAEPSIVFPIAAPFQTRRALSGQPSAFPTSLSLPTLLIPSSGPFFGSTAVPTVDPLVPTIAPGNIRIFDSESPLSSPYSPTLSPDCNSASVVRASQVDKTRSLPPMS